MHRLHVLVVLVVLVSACAAQQEEINEHSWKSFLGDPVHLKANTSGTWNHKNIYNQGNNTVNATHWHFKGKTIPCGATRDINVSPDCESLYISSFEEKHGGFYYVFLNVTVEDTMESQQFRVMRALNVNGPFRHNMLADHYMASIKVASISAGSVLGFLMLVGLINHFRYSTREKRRYGGGPETSGETAF